MYRGILVRQEYTLPKFVEIPSVVSGYVSGNVTVSMRLGHGSRVTTEDDTRDIESSRTREEGVSNHELGVGF